MRKPESEKRPDFKKRKVKDYGPYRDGDIEPSTGKRINKLIMNDTDYIVFLDDGLHVDWAVTDNYQKNGYSPMFSEVTMKVYEMEGQSDNCPMSRSQLRDFRTLLGAAILTMLEKEESNLIRKALEDADTYLKDRIANTKKLDISKKIALERLQALCDAGAYLTNSLYFNESSFMKWKRDVQVGIDTIFGVSGGHSEDFNEALQSPKGAIESSPALASAIRGLDILESMKNEVEYWPDEKEITSPCPAKSPIEIFDAMKFDQKIVEASRSLFEDGYYSEAIFRAFTAVSGFVKEESGSQLDGKLLMSSVFNEDKPIIKINALRNASDRDEQEGFKFLFMGAQIGIRNPNAHGNIVQTDPYRTLEYLSLASLLMKRIQDEKVVKLKPTDARLTNNIKKPNSI
jgi:uncharacterized protein (TIGR02391 family)